MKEIAFGLDLGGTSLKYGLVTRAGEILAQGSVPTGREGRMAGVRAALSEGIVRLRHLAREHGVVPRVT